MKKALIFCLIFCLHAGYSYAQATAQTTLKSQNIPYVHSTLPAITSPAGPVVYVNKFKTPTLTSAKGSIDNPYSSIQEGINAVKKTGGTVDVSVGNYEENPSLNGVLFPVLIKGSSNAPTIVECSSPMPNAWKKEANSNIYTLTVATPVTQVYYQGNFLAKARYPKDNFLKVGADAPIQKDPTQNNLIPVSTGDLSFLKQKDLNQATVTVRAIDYWFNSAVVSKLDLNTNALILDSNPLQKSECYPNCYLRYNAKLNWGYFLENKKWMMTTPGSWVYDAASKQLYVWLPNNSVPTVDNVRFVTDNDCLAISNSPHVTIQNLTIQNAGKSAVGIYNSANIRLNRLVVSNSHRLGINVYASEPFLMDSSIVKNTGSDGLRFALSQSHPAIPPISQVEGNTFENIGTAIGPQYIVSALNFAWGGFDRIPNKIRYNSIRNTAYVGIFAGPGNEITGNIITNFCLLLDDCAGIYTSDAKPASIINNNYLKTATANLNGKARQEYPVAGIYLDDFMYSGFVFNNIILDTDIGIMLHNAHDNIVLNNFIYDFHRAAIRAQEDNVRKTFSIKDGTFMPVYDSSGKTYPAMANNTVSLNSYAAATVTPTILLTSNQGNLTTNLSRLIQGTSNNYNNLQSQTQVLFSNIAYRFEELKTLGIDSAPARLLTNAISPYQTTKEKGILLAGSPQDFPKFNLWAQTGKPVKSVTNCTVANTNTPCLSFSASSSAPSRLVSPSFPVVQNQFYRFNVQLKSNSQRTDPVNPEFVHAATPYESINNLPLKSTFFINNASINNWTTTEFYMQSKTTYPAGRVDLVIPSGFSLLLKSLKVTAVDVVPTDMNNYRKLFSNETNGDLNFACPVPSTLCTGWTDTSGKKVIFPLKVPAHSLIYVQKTQ